MVGHWWVCHLADTNVLQGFPGDAVVKNLPANAGDTGDEGLIPGSEDSLKKEMATHSSILAWKIPWTEEPVRGVHGVTTD